MKTLKLEALQQYCGPKTKNKVIQNGQIITVTDADADYMTREDAVEVVNSVVTKHWTVVPNGTKADFNFTSEEATAEEVEAANDAAAKAAMEEEVKPAARGGQRSRTPRAKAQ